MEDQTGVPIRCRRKYIVASLEAPAARMVSSSRQLPKRLSMYPWLRVVSGKMIPGVQVLDKIVKNIGYIYKKIEHIYKIIIVLKKYL